MKSYTTFFLLIFLISLKVTAQNDSTIHEISNWLEQNELNTILEVYDITENAGFDLLRLKILADTPDLAVQMWNHLDSSFRESNDFSIEEYLFYNYLHTRKKDPTELAIKVKESYSGLSCAELLIYFDTTLLSVGTIRNFCKDIPETIFQLETRDIHADRIAIDMGSFEQGRHETFVSVIDFTTDLYESGGLRGKDSIRINADSYFKGDEKLLIEISGMRKEVLYELDDQWFCRALRWLRNDNSACDFSPWEYIRLEFTYIPVTKNSVKLSCKIYGRYSSGVYDRIIWEHANNMEPDLAPYMKPYLNRYMQKLYAFLTE